MNIIKYTYFICIIGLLFPFIIYPLSLKIISLFYKKTKELNLEKIEENKFPTVTLIISAYNEERVIEEKLIQAINYNYPIKKYKIIIASDDSTDNTNTIVEDFIREHQGINCPEIKLLVVKGRKGKTAVQNEAVATTNSEVVAFSDANSDWENNSLRYLVANFIDTNVGYVCGQLQYKNTDDNITSSAEGKYWNFDLALREMESRIGSIVGGNGAIYAIKKQNYINLDPLLSHDGFMPTKMIIQGKTAKYEPKALVYEKASSSSKDEFKRKVRMQRGQPWKKYYDLQKFNFLKYHWFSYFYFGHKYLKYLLYIFHPVLFITNLLLIEINLFYLVIFIIQVVFYLSAIMGYLCKEKVKIKIFYYSYHYTLTIVAQFVSVFNTLSNKNKSAWEKSESTRDSL